MKRFLGIVVALCWLSGSMHAQQFKEGELWYEVTGKRKVQVISDPTDSIYRLFENITVPQSIVYEGVNYQVVRIDDQAFRYCHFLKSIQLPDGLREIGFQTFMNCTQLIEIHLPHTLQKIDEMAFYGCASLETVYVGKKLKRWPEMCFSDCERLKAIYHSGNRPPRTHRMSFFNCPDSITYYRIR